MIRPIVRRLSRDNPNKYSNLRQGSAMHGFTLNQIQHFDDFAITMYQLSHGSTGAKYYHFDSIDKNNAAALLFRTPPPDSTGMCHILEHLSLCGSKTFPVRDPFFKMIKRSLNTYMNAWTGNDFTMYPFSTKNEKDFHNLLSIYQDAVFFPLLNYHDFRQEGHRLEIEKGNLIEKGVVLNEMKGAMSQPDNFFLQTLNSNLFDKSCYKHNSGGDPHKIVTLSYEKLVEFHKTYYHPSNCTILSYGDMDFRNHLQQINEHALQSFTAKNVDSNILKEDYWNCAKEVEEYCMHNSMQEEEIQSKYAISYLCNSFGQPLEDSRKLFLLSQLMFNSTNSICFKELIETGLGSSFCPGFGYDSTTQQTTFTIGVQGANISNGNDKKLNAAIIKLLNKIKQDGFSRSEIDRVAHQSLIDIV